MRPRTRKKPNGEFVLRDPLPRRWWQYADKRPALTSALQKVARTLVIAQTSRSVAFAFMPPDRVFAHTLVVFPIERNAAFTCLQCRLHLVWAEQFSATMKDGQRYLPSDCFETFPFPDGFETAAALEAAGREYYEFRAALMVRNNEGLTKTYNRFHDPEERSPDILKLRDLHAAMDAAVLTAYGWADLIPQCQCEFLLDYEDEESEEDFETVRPGDLASGASSQSLPVSRSHSRRRRKPWRYRWPDEIRDEVLARLLKLNAERAEEERLAGLAAAKTTLRPGDSGTRRRKAAKSQSRQVAESPETPSPQKDLFG